MDQATIIAIAGSAFFVLLGLFLMPDGSSKANERVKNLSANGRNAVNQKKGLFGFLKAEDTSQRRRQIEDSLSKLEADQKTKKKQRKSLSSKLIQANWETSATKFMLISVVLALIIGAGVYFFSQNPVIAVGMAIGFGIGLPRWFLGFVVSRRQKKFSDGFSDAMDIIVRGVRTGLPLGDCLKIIAHESPEPVAGEFLRVVEGESLGVPIEICLERMFERVPVPEVNFFSTVLNIQKTTGGNLGESLANLSKVIRGRKLLREKIKALSAEAKMSAIIIGCLPIIVAAMVTISSPDYMHDLYYTDTGQRNLMVGAAMMVFGSLVMRKMINFKI